MINIKKIAIELSNIGKGNSLINKKYHDINGFIAELDNNFKVEFIRLMTTNYMAEFYFYYKGLCVISSKLISNNDHWNGTPKVLKIYDGYGRGKDSRHDLEKSIQNYLNWMVIHVYDPMTKKEKEQTLYKDNLYDEYIKTLE